jgi:hypothetical protein
MSIQSNRNPVACFELDVVPVFPVVILLLICEAFNDSFLCVAKSALYPIQKFRGINIIRAILHGGQVSGEKAAYGLFRVGVE